MNFFNNNNRCNNGYCNNNQNDSCCNEQDHYFDGTESGRYCSGAYYYTSCGWNQTCFSTSRYYSDSVNELIYSCEISEQSVSRSCFYFPGKSLAYRKI